MPTLILNLGLAYRNRQPDFGRRAVERGRAAGAKLANYAHLVLLQIFKDSDPKSALEECLIADGMTHDAKLHDQCLQLQAKSQ